MSSDVKIPEWALKLSTDMGIPITDLAQSYGAQSCASAIRSLGEKT